MKENIAIEVENVSKKYRIGLRGENTIRRRLQGLFTSKRVNDFWALKDINITVTKGEILGLIGRNGAGKSTFLKILSRITHPTSGTIKLGGRVSSLLEVGTGFHPELTGRENIYLNGAILGMKRSEIDSKISQIITFAELVQFIDTPVKKYSSGMYVRLAFSVAAHIDSDILLIDEVLSVGDLDFEAKSLEKMNQLTKDGRTVIFVSHDLKAVELLCNKCILFENGKIAKRGHPTEVIQFYKNNLPLSSQDHIKGTRSVSVIDHKVSSQTIGYNENLYLYFTVKNFSGRIYENIEFDIGVNSFDGRRVGWLRVKDNFNLHPNETKKFRVEIFDWRYIKGDYSFTSYLKSNREVLEWVDRLCVINSIGFKYESSLPEIPTNQGDIILNYSIAEV